MADNKFLSGVIPPNPIFDPAELINERLGVVASNLNQLGLDKNLSSSLLSDIKQRIGTTQDNIPTTVGGYMQTIENMLKQQQIAFKPIGNVLDQYSSYTYKIKFCMTTDQTAQEVTSHASWQSIPKEVIAESGVTAGFNIRSFDLKNLCSPQERIGIAPQVSWDMVLVEPYGFSLIDRLYALSRSMGVADHLKCIYFIEVSWYGQQDSGMPSRLEMFKLFRCIIVDINVDSTTSGSVYNINGIIDGSMAQGNEFAMPPSITKVNNVSTLGQFWANFEQIVNEQTKKLDYGNITKRIEYSFVLPEAWKSWKFTRSLNDTSRQSGFETTGKPENPSITIPKGMDFSKILQTVMSMTEEGKSFTLGANTTGKDASKSGKKSETEGIAYIPQVRSKVEFVGYNYYYNDYVRKITYYFSEYPTVRGYIDRAFIDNSMKPDVQKARLNGFVGDGRLQKAYYYQFTGLNTDVLKFDIKLDNYWSALQPLYDGYSSSDTYDTPPQVSGQSVAENVYNDYMQKRNLVVEKQKKLTDLENKDKKEKTGSKYNSDLELAQTELSAARKDLEAFEANTDISNYEIRFSTNSPGEKSIGGIFVKNKALLESRKVREDIAARTAYKLSRNRAQERYLEDVATQDPRSSPLPISTFISKAPNSQNNSKGGLPTSDPVSTDPMKQPKSRGLLASVLDNVTGSQFVNIDLEIRGDPYWIGFDNIEELQYLPPEKRPPTNLGKQTALFGSGECALLLFFRTGEQPNEDSGIVEFNSNSWAFNGLYVVFEVMNHFRDGQFTQTLKAVKDAAMYSLFANAPSSANNSTPSVAPVNNT